MRKIMFIAAALVFAVSCSDWEGTNTEPLKTKIVDRLEYADGSYVRFIYGGERNLISRIEYSAGQTIDISYEGLDSNAPVINVYDGTVTQSWNVAGLTIKTVSVDNTPIINMQYDYRYYYDYMTYQSNSVDYTRTTVNWSNAVPNEKITTWYSDDSFSQSGLVSRQLVRFGWNSYTSPSNWLASIDLLPFIVPEYTEGWGMDPAVVASVGVYCFRSYNLPSTVTVAESPLSSTEDTDADIVDPTSENRVFSYDRDSDGYIEAVNAVNTVTNEKQLMFTVVYAETSDK